MRYVYLAIGLVWLVLLPPVFTAGSCTREFDQANRLLDHHRRDLHDFAKAQALLADKGMNFAVVTAQRCREVKPRFLKSCGSGPLIYLEVPVSNLVCRVYRDDATRIQLQYDSVQRLIRVSSDMAPYKSLPLPWGGFVHWGR